jgi:hypothetical protein
MIAQALKEATPTLRTLATRTKLPYHTLQAYGLGRRTASPRNQRKIAAALRKQAVRLADFAERLDAESEGGENT